MMSDTIANAKEEFLAHIDGLPPIKCATVNEFDLLIGHTPDQYSEFLNQLNTITYDYSFGTQELYGYIWFEDGTWSERGEYDGSEWWEYKACPKIPPELFPDTPSLSQLYYSIHGKQIPATKAPQEPR